MYLLLLLNILVVIINWDKSMLTVDNILSVPIYDYYGSNVTTHTSITSFKQVLNSNITTTGHHEVFLSEANLRLSRGIIKGFIINNNGNKILYDYNLYHNIFCTWQCNGDLNVKSWLRPRNKLYNSKWLNKLTSIVVVKQNKYYMFHNNQHYYQLSNYQSGNNKIIMTYYYNVVSYKYINNLLRIQIATTSCHDLDYGREYGAVYVFKDNNMILRKYWQIEFNIGDVYLYEDMMSDDKIHGMSKSWSMIINRDHINTWIQHLFVPMNLFSKHIEYINLYYQGQQHGISFYFINGTITQQYYHNGKLHGQYISCDIDNNILFTVQMCDDKEC